MPADPPVTDDLVLIRLQPDEDNIWEGPYPVGRVEGDSFWVWTRVLKGLPHSPLGTPRAVKDCGRTWRFYKKRDEW